MSQALQIIGELEVALKSNSTERHLAILKSVTSLFLAGHDRITEEVSAVFDGVMVRLIEHVECRARIELSREVAPIANAPEQVVQRLASDDDIAVAGPVLAQSPRLTDENLVAIAGSKGQSHLSKIAERTALSPVVTDVLVDRGDHDVVTKVAVNIGARFSSTGMSMLAMRASGDSELTLAMTRRPDISPALFKRLLSHATEEARQRMLAAAAPDRREAINRVLTQIASQAGAMTVSANEFAAAERLVLFVQPGHRADPLEGAAIRRRQPHRRTRRRAVDPERRADLAGVAPDLRYRAVRRDGVVQGDRIGMDGRARGDQQSARHQRGARGEVRADVRAI